MKRLNILLREMTDEEIPLLRKHGELSAHADQLSMVVLETFIFAGTTNVLGVLGAVLNTT